MMDMYFFGWEITPVILLAYFILCLVVGIVYGIYKGGKDKWKH